jgi:group II intron reverse transcriptase/maturase
MRAVTAQSKLMTRVNNHILADATSHLMEKVVETENIKKALKRVEGNKGAHGVDNMQVEELRPHLKAHWMRIKQELLEGTYQPAPVRRVEIPKPDGGVRELGIPTVLDRFIQQAIQQILTPIFEPTFSEFSYGFRPGKSARQAVLKAQEYIQSGKTIVVDIDLEKFFDRVNHDLLMTKIAKQVSDRRMHRIIRRYLHAGIMLNGCHVPTVDGVPQGGPLSPLLSNVMLNELDQELTQRGHSFVRYADDQNTYVSSKRAGKRIYASIKKFLENRLKLKVNEQKSAVDRPVNRKFLGFSFTAGVKARLRIAPKTRIKFEEKIRELTKRSWSVSMDQRIKQLNSYLMGWGGYFGIAQTKSIFQELDEWIRRRLRMCLLKQWKLGKTKLANLVKLGIGENWAGCVVFSRKGHWRLAKTPQINKALNLAYWQEQGLVRLVDRQSKMLSGAST